MCGIEPKFKNIKMSPIHTGFQYSNTSLVVFYVQHFTYFYAIMMQSMHL